MNTLDFKNWLLATTVICSFALAGCGGDDDTNTGSDVVVEVPDDTTDDDATDDDTNDGNDQDADDGADGQTAITAEDVNAYGDIWVLNADGDVALNLNDGAGNFPFVNVTGIGEDETGDFLIVNSANMPDYAFEIDQATIDFYESRTDKSDAFVDGEGLSVTAGQLIQFGDDVGYRSNDGCVELGGDGYWPPGPVCPEEQDFEVYLPLEPTEGDGDCDTGLTTVGITVNGIAIFNWSDGMSYNNEGVWSNVVGAFEKYDVDICGGHAAMGTYHHHGYSQCLAETLGDDGSSHSVIHGYAADGYPIYGPHEAEGVLAQSCWIERAYLADDATGCSADSERTCQLIDNKDISQGIEEVSAGPTTNDSVSNLGGTFDFQAVSGIYYEDYYYSPSCTAQGDEYLDQHNGHDTGDGRGYHYHMTTEEDLQTTVFPYTFGPQFRGELADNAVTDCSTGLNAGGGPGGGMGGPPQQAQGKSITFTPEWTEVDRDNVTGY